MRPSKTWKQLKMTGNINTLLIINLFLALSCGLQTSALIPNAVRQKDLHCKTGTGGTKRKLDQTNRLANLIQNEK